MKRCSDIDAIEPEREAESYYYVSRSWGMSVVFILPLVVLYQIGIVQSGSDVRNLAEVWITDPIALLGLPAAAVVNAALLGSMIVALYRSRCSGPISAVFAAFMAIESLIYAFMIFSGVRIVANMLDKTIQNLLTTGWIPAPIMELPRQQLLLGIGAGVYEELFFRVLLIGGGSFLFTRIFRMNRLYCLSFILVISSILFAAAHHIGGAGEPFNSYVFIFRVICGLVLGIIYITRGPGIPVMTHAIYNVMVVLVTSP